MMFITGPLYSGKRTFARNFRGSVIADVQDAAAETQTPEQLETLARELAEYDIVIATEVGGGVVPMDAEERAGREAAGRLDGMVIVGSGCWTLASLKPVAMTVMRTLSPMASSMIWP